MAGNDISSLIQDIYDRYKENQKDKKPEEQMYMSEEEFKANLKSMVNKSEIEDKFMLYNEIYHNITEDALEIDTTGNITISPKVIVNAERAVVRRLEEQKSIDNSKIGIEEVVAVKSILDMTKEEYSMLSDEQKTELFVQSSEWIFGDDKDGAARFIDNARKFDFSKVRGATERYKQNLGDEHANSKETVDNGIDAVLELCAQSKEGKILIKKSKDEQGVEKEVLDEDLLIVLTDMFSSNQWTEEQLYENLRKIGRERDFIQIKTEFNRDEFKDFVLTVKEVMDARTLYDQYLKADRTTGLTYNSILDDINVDIKEINFGHTDMSSVRKIFKKINIKLEKESLIIPEGLKTGNPTIRFEDKSVLTGAIKENGENNARKINDILFANHIGRDEVDRSLSQFARDAVVDQSKLVNPRSMDIEGTTKKYEGVTIDNPKDGVTFENVDLSETDFELSLASISDMEPDMFADMFSDMAEEIVFEEPTFETEKVVQEDEIHEVAEDDRTAQGEKETQILEEVGTEELTEKEVKGIQVEDINVDETLTNTMNNENLPKKITWVDKVRASVDTFGKNVKKAFGSFISAITGKGGENNSGANNSTTSTSSNAGQNKPVQEVNNFVPTVELNLKQAQQATKAAEEAKKNNDARGTDEPTQDDSEIGE